MNIKPILEFLSEDGYVPISQRPLRTDPTGVALRSVGSNQPTGDNPYGGSGAAPKTSSGDDEQVQRSMQQDASRASQVASGTTQNFGSGQSESLSRVLRGHRHG